MPNDNVLTIDRIESLARAHLYVGDDEVVFGTENFARAIEREVLAAHPGQPEQKDAHGWLRSGGLLYRLTDERHPQNRDEINVTMADGSREISGREARAQQLLALLTGQPEPRAEVTDAMIEAAAFAYDTFPCPYGESVGRGPHLGQLRATLQAAIDAARTGASS